ncbi:2-oxoglutarate and Fe(II)-dependent oxygenase [Raphidocelis subcapitata]|uniref:2-oxoglutarate and Fe(II)-dependent oxygenase n=1 Tax=Raphidocelis subcapitata TaxID=307507 RepID=A0A2V0NXU3_9CHLO|nr:2-oxoglutarate and Fe(II)-dependent oxygenase [Raphidocelis subcapitata]|eukprot:GBF92159.1 2-oxoglutarate and Fe(II)-dependent oxygenase [Raphidocelis subcapitata]
MGRSAGGQQAAAAGAWPKISRKAGLKAERLLGDQLMLVPGVLTVSEAQALIDAAERAGFSHQGSRGAAYGEAFRDNDRIQFPDAALAAQLWDNGGLAPLFDGISVDGERAVGLNDNIRLYRYRAGQKFGKHIDDSVEVGPGRATRYTLLVYLSGQDPSSSASSGSGAGDGARAAAAAPAAAAAAAGGRPKRAPAGKHAAAAPPPPPCACAVQPLQGGQTIFYGDRGRVLASVAPRPGLALLHLHGEDRCMEHEAAAVAAGTKYVLRSDVVFSAA